MLPRGNTEYVLYLFELFVHITSVKHDEQEQERLTEAYSLMTKQKLFETLTV